LQRDPIFIDLSYAGVVTKNVAKTVTDLAERMGNAGPPTEDEVTTLLDGRRLHSKEAVEMWLIEVDAIRKSQATDHALGG
jgi:hypothetical protein